jgi:hypothetical protein
LLALRKPIPNHKPLTQRAIVERERDFEVKLATQIAVSNPDLALKIGSQSLRHGFSDNLLPLLNNCTGNVENTASFFTKKRFAR